MLKRNSGEKPLPDIDISRKTCLLEYFPLIEKEEVEGQRKKPRIKAKKWDPIDEAVKYIHLLEMITLDELISSYVEAVIRTKTSPSLYNTRALKRCAELLDLELSRQNISPTAIAQYRQELNEIANVEKQKVEQTILFALQKISEAKLARIRYLMEKRHKSNTNPSAEKLTPEETKEFAELVAENRRRKAQEEQRRKKRRK